MFSRSMYESGLIAWTIHDTFILFNFVTLTCLKNFSSTTTHLFNASFISRHLCLSHLPLIFNSSFLFPRFSLVRDHKTKASFPTRSNKLFSTFAFFSCYFFLFLFTSVFVCVFVRFHSSFLKQKPQSERMK